MNDQDKQGRGADAETNPRVVVEHLTVRIQATGAEVVRDVSLTLTTGEILGIVGESGSGKTTLGLAMIGHTRRGLEVASGRVSVNGMAITGLSAKAMVKLRGNVLAYVPQDPGTALNPARRIGSQMREALTAHGRTASEADERILQMLGEVGLSSVAGVLDAFPHQLSGGQQQRVAIAMAFACRPSLIVMDEPTTGLDATTQRTILDTVKSLRRKYGLAMIYVSHDLAVVSELANRVAVLYAGRVVESGPASEVLSNPQHPYTRGLVRAVPSAQRRIRLVAMDGIRPQIGQADAICSFEPRCAISSVKCKAEFPQMTVVGKEQHVVRCLLANTVESREAAVLRANDDGDAQIEHSAADAGQAGPVLQINNLQAYYGGHHVLRGINLSVGQNECVALVGESGSGKTTLTRCLVGLHQSWTGEMRFEREPLHPRIGQRSGASLLKMQYVFQNPYASLNPRRTIGGLIMQPLEHFTKLDRKAMERRIAETMDAVSLPKRLLNAYPDQLSGGERQRVAIARALVVRPHLLICDEITSALDVSVQASVIEMLRRLQKEQSLSLLFITHNLPLVRSIAQQVFVLQAGQLMEGGAVEDVLNAPQTDYTRRLISDLPRFERFAEPEERGADQHAD